MTEGTATTQKATEQATWAEVKCAFCRGTGKDPFGVMSILSNCPSCGGTGTARVKEPYVVCRACRGTGVLLRSRLPCLGCDGKGVSHVKEPTQTCPVCKGTGLDGLHLYCLGCHGAGVISK